MRLIDADALVKEANTDGAYGYVDAAQIEAMPTIDPENLRPQGKWIPYHEADFGWDEYGRYCSRCKWKVEDDDIRFSMDYCPKCGARMKVKK